MTAQHIKGRCTGHRGMVFFLHHVRFAVSGQSLMPGADTHACA
jgi:hypothetical protein